MNNGFSRELARFGPGCSFPVADISQARSYCTRLARRHYENFTVASLLLPRRLLPHFHAVYAYCRWADDLGDETGGGPKALALLCWWREELLRCYQNKVHHPVMVALHETIMQFHIPPQPFLDLLLAFEQDQRIKRYQTFEQLSTTADIPPTLSVTWCFTCANATTANGQFLPTMFALRCNLPISGRMSPVTLDIGRVYLPEEDCKHFGYMETDLEDRRCTPAFVELMRFEVERTRDFFQRGFTLVEDVPADVRADIELFIRGGEAILRKIEQGGYNVWQVASCPGKMGKGRLAWQGALAAHTGKSRRVVRAPKIMGQAPRRLGASPHYFSDSKG